MRKQVYAEWANVNAGVWKLDKDPRTSVMQILAQYEGKEEEMITIRREPGIAVVAFAVKYAVTNWAMETVEIGIDGTCKYSRIVPLEKEADRHMS